MLGKPVASDILPLLTRLAVKRLGHRPKSYEALFVQYEVLFNVYAPTRLRPGISRRIQSPRLQICLTTGIIDLPARVCATCGFKALSTESLHYHYPLLPKRWLNSEAAPMLSRQAPDA